MGVQLPSSGVQSGGEWCFRSVQASLSEATDTTPAFLHYDTGTAFAVKLSFFYDSTLTSATYIEPYQKAVCS